MNCRDARQQIFAERDGALDEVRRAALVAHVAACGSCRQLRDNFSSAVENWRAEVDAVPVPNAEFEWHKVRREMRERTTIRKRPVAAWLALPAAAAAAVAIGFYITPHGTPTAAPAATQIAAVKTAPVAATTPDSTVVFVDDKSGWTFVWAPDSAGTGQHI